MPLWHIGEESGKDRAEQAGKRINHTALFAHLHYAKPQGEYAGQS